MKSLHKQLLVAGQIRKEDLPFLKESGVTAIINNRPDGEEPGQPSASEISEAASEHGISYHFLPMANGQPMPANLVESFREIVESEQGAVLAHCRSGMRSSFIWALGAIADGEVSVDTAIEKAMAAGIPLNNARAVLETVQP